MSGASWVLRGQKETGRLARFRERRLRCGYIAAKRWLALEIFTQARFASASASRASKIVPRSEDESEGATVGPMARSMRWFQL